MRRYFRDANDPFITAFVTRSSNGVLPCYLWTDTNYQNHSKTKWQGYDNENVFSSLRAKIGSENG
jgi:hypothetical protein